MENIKITNKYLQAIRIVLIAIAFSMILPVITSAQTYTDPYGSYDTYTDPYGSYDTYTDSYGNYDTYTDPYGSYDTYTDPYGNYDTYTDPYGSYDTNTDTYGDYGNDINTDTNTYNNNYGNNYSGYGYGYGYSTVSSGGYSLGNSTYVTPTSYGNTLPTTVTSGSYTQGNSTYVDPATYNYPQSATVTSGGYSGLSPVYYGQPTLVQNQVLAYTDTNPSLDSVYLSDVPYTGFEDYYGILIFISALVTFSAILAYIFLKRKIESENTFSKAYINKAEIKSESNDIVTSEIINQNVFDNSDISKVNDYARIYKVLLSSDAAAKIVKLSRLGKINPSEYIRSVASGEWLAIGESQIN